MELHLLRSCLGIGKVNHILRTVQADLIAKELDDFDNQLRSIFSDILHGTVSENAWTQASLPFRLGGLGLRSASRSASAAYLASVNMSRSTMAHLLADIPSSSPLAGLEFELLPGEIEAKRQLENTLNMLIEHTPSQATYQAELDTQLFDILKSRLNIRDRARLLAVAADNSTSSWLKAVPIQSLGLTMPSSEFITSLKIWLGIPIFSPQPTVMCPCGQPVDIYGDHLLECNHGPFRIRRHDSLRDVIWHALLQDNTTVCREQRITGDCHDRPGDIYHPDFSNGKPSFFDISVRSSLQASSISQSSITAGVAGARGEMQKDEKHRQLVEENGGVFIPLVVESYGLWTPFAKKTLKSIALRTIVRSGLEVKMATRNLFEQLSIKLWSYNAKIILNILSLLPVNPLWDLP